jgi:2-C-methyl-D-erythritol 4-phosphate cytidylyltransferase/2-C-methyl-D-erythritol 2,4-cyclodiphosphate synthase
MVRDRGGSITGVDVTLVAESPPLAPHVGEMRARLASALGIEVPHVSVKAKTNDGLGDLGRGEAMAAHAIATVRHPQA